MACVAGFASGGSRGAPGGDDAEWHPRRIRGTLPGGLDISAGEPKLDQANTAVRTWEDAGDDHLDEEEETAQDPHPELLKGCR